MKTRCRNYGRRQRMTASELPPSKQDNTAKDIEKAGDLTEEIAGKDSQVLHETRSQKQASQKRLHEDHAETTKDSSFAEASETANNPVGVATRSSTRPSKRPKLSTPATKRVGNQENSAGSEAVASSSSPPQANRRKKQVKRQWESWGKAEKDTFFEALHEYGKDFDKICNFIATKHKRRGDPLALIKNKDQVRHFYYRSLNKIAKYLPAEQLSGSDNQKKMIIELKGLICYGELRKKICGWNDKHGKKLEELLSHGTITIRSKGRNFKIKAPVQCRALKRLTSTGQGKEDGDTQSLAMPNKLVLELLPHNHSAWAAVQKLSKNPRLRTSVPPKKPLNLMLHFLTKKWHIVSQKTLEPLNMCIVIPPEFYVSSDVLEKQAGSPACRTPSGDLENVATPDVLPLEDMAKTCSPSSLEEGKSSGANVFGLNGILQHAPHEVGENGCTTASPEHNTQGSSCADNRSQTDKSAETLLNVESSSQRCTETTMESCSTSEPAKQDEKGSCNDKNNPSFWTLETCGNITFGEIFCKLGRPPKLKLEYTWDDIENNLAPSQTAVSLTKLVNIAAAEFSKGKEGSVASKTTSKSSDATLTKSCSQSVAKDKGASSNVPKEKTVSKSTRPVTKTSDKLPFILPSVVPPATQTPTNRTIISDLSSLARSNARMRKRQQRPNVHRTLLPRPVGSPSSVPPGAVAVSFIPQPGQTVGTILASGVSTSTATVTTQSKTVLSSKTVAETSSSSELPVVTSLVDTSSPHAVAENVITNTNSADLGLEMSGFADTDLLAVMDQFVGDTKSLGESVVTTSNSVDSIIGLALGTALDGNGTQLSIAGISEDSNSAFLASLASSKASNLDLAAQTVQRISSNTELTAPDVHIEELNSGVAGGVPSSMASPTLENILNPTGSTAQSPVSTTCDVFFSSTGPISSIVDSQSQQEALIGKESLPVPSLMLSPNADSGLSSSFQTHWFNGESSNFSIGSLLDKLTTSPKKDERLVSLEDSSGASAFKEPSQDTLLSSHHLLDPETALQHYMDENSVDFVKKFQDLAKEMAGENNKTPTSSSSSGPLFPALSNTEANSRSSDDSNSGSLNFKHILRQTNMNGS
ncbi:uncharacterized protein LOC144653384 isoform X1 [Oculina patagonica]